MTTGLQRMKPAVAFVSPLPLAPHILYLLFQALNALVINPCDHLSDVCLPLRTVSSMEAASSLTSSALGMVFGTRRCWGSELLLPPVGLQPSAQ